MKDASQRHPLTSRVTISPNLLWLRFFVSSSISKMITLIPLCCAKFIDEMSLTDNYKALHIWVIILQSMKVAYIIPTLILLANIEWERVH